MSDFGKISGWKETLSGINILSFSIAQQEDVKICDSFREVEGKGDGVASFGFKELD